MSITYMTICFLLALVCAFLLIRPHLYSKAITTETETISQSNLLDQKERCLQVLKDLELDLATGKLEEDEYSRMKTSVSSELAGILAAIDEQAIEDTQSDGKP